MDPKATIIVVHGYTGRPTSGWKSWFKEECAKVGVVTVLPAMPSPDDPIENEWVSTLAAQVERANTPIVLVGHSLGGATVLRYLEKEPVKPIKAAVLLASVAIGSLHQKHPAVARFINRPIDFAAIKTHAQEFLVINSSNDGSIPPEEGEMLAKELDCPRILLENRGHFSSSEGTTEIPELLAEIKKILAL